MSQLHEARSFLLTFLLPPPPPPPFERGGGEGDIRYEDLQFNGGGNKDLKIVVMSEMLPKGEGWDGLCRNGVFESMQGGRGGIGDMKTVDLECVQGVSGGNKYMKIGDSLSRGEGVDRWCRDGDSECVKDGRGDNMSMKTVDLECMRRGIGGNRDMEFGDLEIVRERGGGNRVMKIVDMLSVRSERGECGSLQNVDSMRDRQATDPLQVGGVEGGIHRYEDFHKMETENIPKLTFSPKGRKKIGDLKLNKKKNLTVNKERVQFPVKLRKEIFEEIIRKETEEKRKYEPRRKKADATERENLDNYSKTLEETVDETGRQNLKEEEENDLVKTIERKYVDVEKESVDVEIFENLTRIEDLKVQELLGTVVSRASQPFATPTQCQKMGGGSGRFCRLNSSKMKNVIFKKISQGNKPANKRSGLNLGCTVARPVLTCAVSANPEQALHGRPEDRLPPNPCRLPNSPPRLEHPCAQLQNILHSAACLEGNTNQSEEGPGSCDCRGTYN